MHIHLTPDDGGVQAVVMAAAAGDPGPAAPPCRSARAGAAAAGYGNVSLDFAAGGEAAPDRDERRLAERDGRPRRRHAVAAARWPQPAGRLAGGLDIRL